MTHIAGHPRSQMLLLPESVDDYVGADNPVRFIDAFVDVRGAFDNLLQSGSGVENKTGWRSDRELRRSAGRGGPI